VIDRTDRQFFSGNGVADVVGRLGQGLAAQGLQLTQIGPSNWQARSNQATYGLVPKVSLSVSPSPNGFCLDVRFTCDFEGTAVIGLVVAWLFCFPAALILAVLAYQDITERLRQLHAVFWAPVQHLIVAPNYPAPAWQQAPPGGG
jgi:hypothetical protein